MPAKTVRVISWNERSWVRREYQQFCGTYELDVASGLYFDSGVSDAHRRLISRTFRKLPQSLRDAALYLGLTVSTTSNAFTLSGNASTVYGDWERAHAQISPHLEMSEASLDTPNTSPHLAHECCHLLWAIQTKAAKAAYLRKMVELVEEQFDADNFVEVTGYAQSYFDEWRKLLDADGFGIQTRRNRALEKWAVESFCESVAKSCYPDYKQEEERYTDELLEARLEIIADVFDFEPESRLAVAYA